MADADCYLCRRVGHRCDSAQAFSHSRQVNKVDPRRAGDGYRGTESNLELAFLADEPEAPDGTDIAGNESARSNRVRVPSIETENIPVGKTLRVDICVIEYIGHFIAFP